jgi:hypothetical protein
MGRRRRGGRLAKSLTELIEEFKGKYPEFEYMDTKYDFWEGGREYKEIDPIGDLIKWQALILGRRDKTRKSFFSFRSLAEQKIIYGQHFFYWVLPNDWDIYLQANENLRSWRKRLSKNMQRKMKKAIMTHHKQQWRADERRRSRQKMPGR